MGSKQHMPKSTSSGTGSDVSSASSDLDSGMGNAANCGLMSDPETFFEMGTLGAPASLTHTSALETSFGKLDSDLTVYKSDETEAVLDGLNANSAYMNGVMLLRTSSTMEEEAHEYTHHAQYVKAGKPSASGVSSGGEEAEKDAEKAPESVRKGEPVHTEAKPGAAVQRWGLGSIWKGIKKGASKAWDGVTSVADKVGDAVSGAVDWAGDKASDAVDWVGDKASDAVTWVGDKASDAVDWVKDKAGDVWDGAVGWVEEKVGPLELPGVNENKYTGAVDIPKDQGDLIQQFTPLGIPSTDEAWDMQDRIDGGKLRRAHTESLLGSLDDAGVLESVVSELGVTNLDVTDAGAMSKSLGEMDQAQLTSLMRSLDSNGQVKAFKEAMADDKQAYTDFQVSVLDTYMAMANNDENAAFFLEVLPTETETSLVKQGAIDSVRDLISGDGSNDFRATETVSQLRAGTVSLSEQMRDQGKNTYGLVIPYANTPENIVATQGRPADAVEHMQNYVQELEDHVTTVGFGYSQGGRGVLDYVTEHANDEDALDYAVAMAPMGGNGVSPGPMGETGVWNGKYGNTEVLSVLNEQDPAKEIHTGEGGIGGYWGWLQGMLNFTKGEEDPDKRGYGEIHAGVIRDENGVEDPFLGTYGYPFQEIEGMVGDLFAGAYSDNEYGHQGEWWNDARSEEHRKRIEDARNNGS